MKRLLLIFGLWSMVYSPWSALAAQTLTLHGRDEPQTLDPQLATGIVEANILGNLIEGLTRYHPETNLSEQGMAEKVTVAPDGLTYTFKIRKDAFWSDGVPVTAQHFWDGWERILNPATGGQYAWNLYLIKNAESYNSGTIKDPKQLGFRVVDEKTFQVTLKNPAPYFINMIPHHSYDPARQDIIKKYGDQWTRPGNMVSNGPFVLKSWVANKEIILARNPKYWDKNVKLETVRFVPAPDYETAIKMYDSGQLDTVFDLPPVKVPDLKSRQDFVGKPYLNNEYYMFNIQKAPFNDPKVRQALAMAVDRKVITEKVLRRGDVPLGTFTPPGIPGYVPPKGIEFNPEKAKQLLKEAGYGPGGKPFPSIEILYNTTAEKKIVAEVVQSMWKQHLGINATLRNEEWKSYLQSMHKSDFQVCRTGWIGDYIDPNTFLDMLYSRSIMNYGHYNNPKYDQWIEQAAKERSTTNRAALLQQAEALLLQEAGILPLYSQTKNLLVKPYVKGYYPTFSDVHPLHRASVEK